jgi:hypothetical protein
VSNSMTRIHIKNGGASIMLRCTQPFVCECGNADYYIVGWFHASITHRIITHGGLPTAHRFISNVLSPTSTDRSPLKNYSPFHCSVTIVHSPSFIARYPSFMSHHTWPIIRCSIVHRVNVQLPSFSYHRL